MSIDLRIEKESGTTITLDTIGAEIEEVQNDLKQGRVWVYASDLETELFDLEPGQDEAFFEEDNVDQFGGILRDVRNLDNKAEIIIESFEAYAVEAQPIDVSIYDNATDEKIIKDALGNVSQLSEGTIENLNNNISKVFARAKQNQAIRTVLWITGAKIQFNNDKTVDYVEDPGTDHDVTISPGNQNVLSTPDTIRRSGKDIATHFIVVGASEGNQQRKKFVVPSSDGQSYDNRVDYTADNWSSGDRRIWDTVSFKDQTDENTLGDLGKRMAEDRNKRLKEIRVTITDAADVGLYDTFPVELPSENINERMTVIERIKKWLPSGKKYDLRLTTRPNERRRERQKAQDDIRNYNKSFEGQLNHFETGYDRKPVSSNFDYILKFDYPSDIVNENKVELKIKGLPFRSYVSASGHAHDVNDSTFVVGSQSRQTLHDNSGTATVSSGSPTQIDSFSITSSDTGYPYPTSVVIEQASTTSETITELSAQIVTDLDGDGIGETVGELIPDTGNAANDIGGYAGGTVFYDAFSTSNSDIFLQTNVESSSGNDIDLNFAWIFDRIDPHNHSFNSTSSSEAGFSPGINQWDGTDKSPAHYPENVDIIINGTSEGTSFGNGTGEFSQTYDLSGKLNQGQENTIKLTSDGIGHLSCSVVADIYRQVIVSS